MTYLSDIEIANSVEMKPINDVAKKIDLDDEQIINYGNYKAKINVYQTDNLEKKQDGKLILVTAINPTPAGEGKTTTSVGLVDGLNKIGKKAIIALREPSLGPVFGMKGGAAGGGRAQVVPMEDINLHFTGDFHAISTANNLLAALIDNHIHQGNTLQIDNRNITWKRVIDMNDRQLRHIVNGLNGKINGVPREDGFDITAASEIMAILCLATGPEDLKEKLKKIVIGYNYQGEPVTVKELKAEGALAAILKDAIHPNLVQTLEHAPAIIHGGPFANIAHGCNSVLATKLALNQGDYTVTEAGFGADLGAEKFFDIKCRLADLKPNAVVVVATIRALKMHGGVPKNQLELENTDAVIAGFKNLEKHIDTIKNVFNMPVVVAINKFPLDTEDEIRVLKDACTLKKVDVVLSDVWALGGEGGIELAKKVVELAEEPHELTYAYELSDSIEEKLTKIVQRVYGGKGVELTKAAQKQLKELERLGFSDLPICMSKTQYSLSDDPTKIGAPKDFIVTIRQLKLSAGAGFIVALTGAIMTMPGLPKSPAAEKIDIDKSGEIVGLF